MNKQSQSKIDQTKALVQQAKKDVAMEKKRKKIVFIQMFADRVQQEIVLEQLLAAPQVCCHYKLVRELELLKSSRVGLLSHTLITKSDLVPIFFFHASHAEK